MDDYQDQAIWFEVYGNDGFDSHFIAEFDTRDQADAYVATEPRALEGLDPRVIRRRGMQA